MSWEKVLKQEWPDRIKYNDVIWELFKKNNEPMLNEGKGQYSTTDDKFKREGKYSGTPFTITITLEQAMAHKI
tara:strand:- start:617 stop:835 length:219 start_codon:yes stop_codon:yes gene_type:complete